MRPSVALRCDYAAPGRFNVKLVTLLAPTAIVTVILALPDLALAGTLHLIFLWLQVMRLVHFVAPNLTELVPRAKPNSVAVMVTSTPRLAAMAAGVIQYVLPASYVPSSSQDPWTPVLTAQALDHPKPISAWLTVCR